MKALKEKRIRLRSLWRRGLVILSLFALVFASCNSSDAPESETQPTTTDPEKMVAVDVALGGTPKTQYEGLKFNADGLKVTVTYLNGDKDIYDGGTAEFEKLFEIKPPYIQGVILKDADDELLWMPVTEYTVHWKVTGNQIGDPMHPTVIPIQRGLVSGNTSFATFPISGLFSVPLGASSAAKDLPDGVSAWPITGYTLPKALLGTQSGYVTNSTFNFVGDLDLLDKGVRVDDPALTTITTGEKFRLQATYADLTVQEIPLKDNPNIEARFITFYGAGRDGASGTAAGELLVALTNAAKKYGDDTAKTLGNTSFLLNGIAYNPPFTTAPLNSTRNGKLTAMHYIPKVYNVDKIEISGPTADLDKDTSLYLKYWEDDTGATWLTKSALLNADVKITYTGARPDEENFRTLKLSALFGGSNGGIVWESPNSYNTDPNTDDGDYSVWQTIGVSNVRNTATVALNKGLIKSVAWNKLPGSYTTEDGVDLYPAIRVNYRGAIGFVPVDIVNLVDSFQVNWLAASKYQPGGEIGYLDMRWERSGENRKENDIATAEGGGGPSWNEATWGKELKGTVQYHSVRGNDLPEQAVTLTGSTQTTFGQGAPTLFDKFTSNYGPLFDDTKAAAWTVTGSGDTRDWKFNEATWGTAGIKKNGSRTGTDKNISVFYMPPAPKITDTNITGKITQKLQKQTVPVRFRGIGILEEYRTPFKD